MEIISEFANAVVSNSATKEDIDGFIVKLKSGDLDGELDEIQQMASEQLAYLHPLKLKKQREYHELGEHNQRVVDALKQLKDSDNTTEAFDKFKSLFA